MGNAAAIEALEKRLADVERKGNALIEVINDLREEDGLPPRPSLGAGPSDGRAATAGGGQIHNIQPDTFYGKKMQTAVREYLGMRKAANQGPATPREIYDALKSGGFQSEAKSDDVALVSLRAMMRKRTAYFHKLPNGTYGLTKWYPDAKAGKSSVSHDDDDNEDEAETADADDASAA